MTEEGTKKIAFCFLIYDKINNEDMWKNFFDEADPEKYSIYVHYKENKPLKHFDKYKLEKSLPTQNTHVSLIHAYNYLFREAYSDPLNYKFCILSGACIPLKSFDHVYEFLTRDNKGHFNRSRKHECYPRADNLLTYYAEENIQKSSGWFVLNRNLVKETAFEDEHWINSLYGPVFAPEEHYYITQIYEKDLRDEIYESPNTPDQSTTFTNWGDMEYKYIDHHGLKNYERISLEEWNHLQKAPCLFGRKFKPGFSIVMS